MSSPFVEVANDELVRLFIVADMWPGQGLTEIRFAIPTPPCATLLRVFPTPTSGTLETGAVFEFDGCVTGRSRIVTLQYLTSAVDSCCPLMIRPYQSTTGFDVEGTDCNGTLVRVERSNVVLQPPGFPDCGHPTVPSNPWPPDGASDVSLTPTFSWESEPTAGTGLGTFEMQMHIGLTPDPPLFEVAVFPPFTPGSSLEPATTYYWRIWSVVFDFGGTLGPVWHFTTTTATPVRSSTWGAIKALYR
jgi:hypothetical protein